ncbi:MAG: prephenate dehydrogenase/arogenate dehydrogenase family protein [Armatimonadota bacterium]
MPPWRRSSPERRAGRETALNVGDDGSGFLVGTLGIAGVGLIGGSVGLAARARGLARHVVGIGRSAERLKLARELGAVDDFTTDLLEGASRCDLLYLATPVLTIIEQLRQLPQLRGHNCVVTDGGSVKGAIVRAAEALPAEMRFVGGHPMAGSEDAGVEVAREDLFEGATYVLTPGDRTDPSATELVRRFAEALGSRVVEMSPETHDRIVACTSHLPHIAAGAFLRVAEAAGPGVRDVRAGSFRDLTRVAASPSTLWRDICCANRGPILDALRQFREALARAEELIAEGTPEEIESWFETGRHLNWGLTAGKEAPE